MLLIWMSAAFSPLSEEGLFKLGRKTASLPTFTPTPGASAIVTLYNPGIKKV